MAPRKELLWCVRDWREGLRQVECWVFDNGSVASTCGGAMNCLGKDYFRTREEAVALVRTLHDELVAEHQAEIKRLNEAMARIDDQ